MGKSVNCVETVTFRRCKPRIVEASIKEYPAFLVGGVDPVFILSGPQRHSKTDCVFLHCKKEREAVI